MRSLTPSRKIFTKRQLVQSYDQLESRLRARERELEMIANFLSAHFCAGGAPLTLSEDAARTIKFPVDTVLEVWHDVDNKRFVLRTAIREKKGKANVDK